MIKGQVYCFFETLYVSRDTPTVELYANFNALPLPTLHKC